MQPVAERVGKEFYLETVEGVDWYVDLATGAASPSLPKGAVLTDKPIVQDEIDTRQQALDDAASDADLVEALDHQAVAWVPQDVGDKITGVVVERYQVDTDYGTGVAEALDIQTSSGMIAAVRGYGQVLDSQIRRRDPQPGDRIGISYLGLVESKAKGHQPYRNFRVVVRPAAGK